MDVMINTPEKSVRDFIALQFQPGNSASIEVQAETSLMRQMFQRMSQQWTAMGEHEPYASVLSEEKYHKANLRGNLEEFFSTGSRGIHNLLNLCLKNGIKANAGILFELGCGVGRSTCHFAPLFREVVAWDVSPGNLAECQSNLHAMNRSNVTLNRILDLDDFENIPSHDVFFSEIVIQHNPPPLQYYLLDRIFKKINPGGIFYFQTITHHGTYNFSAEKYLMWQHDQGFEMHALPMRHIIHLIQKSGLTLLDILKDRLGGFNLDSYTFFGHRPH
jgi:SAM-dependent methyltransferase